METPVAILAFNRPSHTARVFEAVRAARPKLLFAVTDGPRAQVPEDAKACRAVRAIFDEVDWPCEVVRIFSDQNLGCRQRIGSGITEVFQHAESCILLEDDCLPHPTFFPYTAELLKRHANEPRVMAVSGDGFTNVVGKLTAPWSYYFTQYVHIWGWATWRRAWAHYDGAMTQWPALRDSGWLDRRFRRRADRLYWKLWFEMCHDGRLNTWDVAWVFNCWAAGGMAICPDRNLVTNIGFDAGGTHTVADSPLANLPTRAMTFPMRHPPNLDAWRQGESWTADLYVGSQRQRWRRWKRYFRDGLKAGL